MAPEAPDFPGPYSAVLASLQDAQLLVGTATAPVPTDVLSTGVPPDFPGQGEPVSDSLRSCAQALRSCGQVPLALVVEGCAAAWQRMQAIPSLQGSEASGAIGRALQAVLEHAQQPAADPVRVAVDLFPLHRAVQHLAGADRVHPADLWPARHSWVDLPPDPFTPPRALDAATRETLEAALLALMRQPQAQDFQHMSQLCAALGEGASAPQDGLWKLASAVYEAQADQLLAPDVYLKRLGPRLLALTRSPAGPAAAVSLSTVPAPLACPEARADATLAGPGPLALPDTWRLLGHELLFFCHRAWAAACVDGAPAPGPRLQRFAEAHGLSLGSQAPPVATAVEEAQAHGSDERVEEGSLAAEAAPAGASGLPLGLPDMPVGADLLPEPPGTVASAASGLRRSLADAVPGLPSAADLDLSSWGLAANADQAAAPDDEVKVIGSLRLEIPAFNAFLNDADEASRQLAMLLSEWSIEPTQPLPDAAASQARVLALGAEKIGHQALASLATLFEAVLLAWSTSAVQPPSAPSPRLTPEAASQLFTAAADEVRRVLHQFAAGFLTEPSAGCVARLAACLPSAQAAVDASAHASDLAAFTFEPLPESLNGESAEAVALQVALAQGGPGPAGYLQELVQLQSGVQQSLDRLAQFRPSKVAAAPDLEEADRAFKSAWAEAADGLAACERALHEVLKTGLPVPPPLKGDRSPAQP